METSQQASYEWHQVSRIEFFQPIGESNQWQSEIHNIIASPQENLTFLGRILLVLGLEGAGVYLDLKNSQHLQSQKGIELCEKHLLHWVEKQLGGHFPEDSYKLIRLCHWGQEDVQASQGKGRVSKELARSRDSNPPPVS